MMHRIAVVEVDVGATDASPRRRRCARDDTVRPPMTSAAGPYRFERNGGGGGLCLVVVPVTPSRLFLYLAMQFYCAWRVSRPASRTVKLHLHSKVLTVHAQ